MFLSRLSAAARRMGGLSHTLFAPSLVTYIADQKSRLSACPNIRLRTIPQQGFPVGAVLNLCARQSPQQCSDSNIFTEVIHQDCYGLREDLIQPGDTVLDIGAHKGFFSILAAGLTGEHGCVIAVEPMRLNREKLVRSKRDNGLKNIRVIAAAISDSNSQEPMCITSNNTGGHC